MLLHVNVPCSGGGSPAYLEIDKLPDGTYWATVGTLFEHQEICRTGMVLKDLGDLDGARKAYQRALAIDEEVLGPDHQRTQTVRSNLAALAVPSRASFSADREGA